MHDAAQSEKTPDACVGIVNAAKRNMMRWSTKRDSFRMPATLLKGWARAFARHIARWLLLAG